MTLVGLPITCAYCGALTRLGTVCGCGYTTSVCPLCGKKTYEPFCPDCEVPGIFMPMQDKDPTDGGSTHET